MKNLNNKPNLVVGSGLSGATIANLLAKKLKKKVLLMEKNSFLGGMCADYKKDNIIIQKFGSHIFHTNHKKVWDFLSEFSSFNSYIHQVEANLGDISCPLPFNFNSIEILFGKSFLNKILRKAKEYALPFEISIFDLKNLALKDEDFKIIYNYIYNNIFLNYSKKQWGEHFTVIDKEIFKRFPIRFSFENNFFNDEFQGMPKDGYSNLIFSMLQDKNIEIFLNCDFSVFKKENKNIFENYNIFFTGSIDEFFEYKYGILDYRSLEFEFLELEEKFFQKHACVNYPNEKDFTRIHEFKHFYPENMHKIKKTIIAKEFPKSFIKGKNERFYPILNKKNIEKYTIYKNLVNDCKNLYFLGRLGDYKYFNMDLAILNALNLFESLK